MSLRTALFLLALGLLAPLLGACGGADVILATTTSTQDSGLLDVLIPAFEKESGYSVSPVAVGSGQALALGERGEADVLLVHSPDAEEEFMATGHGSERRPVMHNDFIVVGPPGDPAGIGGLETAEGALSRLAAARADFFSRGDESGTHAREKELWEKAGVAPFDERWYRETGQGMAQTLFIANEKDGYTLTDRGTYLSLRERLRLAVLVEGDPALLNVYHVILVNPEKSDKINVEGARAFADFITSARGQEMIATFGVDEFGEPLFSPDARVGAPGRE